MYCTLSRDRALHDELSSTSSPSSSLSPTKNARENAKAKSRKSLSHHPAFSDVVSGASRRTTRETSRRKNQPIQVPRNASVLPEGTMPLVLPVGMMPQMSFIHLTFGIGPTFYMPPTDLICRLDDMLYSALGQHILDYEPPRGFVIPAFATFDGSTDSYNHMLHYN